MLATVGGATLPVIIPLFKAVGEKIKESYYNFSDKEITEIQSIQKAYEKHVQTIEANTIVGQLGLSTLKAGTDSDNGLQDSKQKLPVFFQMDPKNPKIPLLFSREFCPEKDSTEWMRYVADNELKPYIEDIIGYICEYQCERDQRFWSKKGYYYDPTNLFFEEFKYWLLELARTTVSAVALDIVSARIAYLREITDKTIFQPGTDRPTRQEIILYITEILEKAIKPLMQAMIDRASAREHFNNLKVYISLVIKNSIRFLFYVYRDSENIPQNFILEQIRNPTISLYKAALDNTTGLLLQYLLKTPVLQLVFPPLNTNQDDNEPKEITYNDITKNNFTGDGQALQYPLTLENANTNKTINWLNENSGILTYFQDKVDPEKILRVHSNIQKLGIFYIICDLLFELAGDGGNLLVYGMAANEIDQVIAVYRDLIDNVNKDINSLFSLAKGLHDNIGKNKVQPTKEINRWDSHYHLISNAQDDFKKNTAKAEELIKTIKRTITKVNQPEYKERVKQRLLSFFQLVNYFRHSNAQNTDMEPARASSKLLSTLFHPAEPKLTNEIIENLQTQGNDSSKSIKTDYTVAEIKETVAIFENILKK